MRLQNGLKSRGFNIGDTNTCVTPVYLEGSIPEAMVMVNDLTRKLWNFPFNCGLSSNSKRNDFVANDSNSFTYIADIDETLNCF
jgi:glycine C-acetyltransferase